MFGRYKVGQVDQHDKKWARSISMMKIIFSVIIKVSTDKVIDPGTLYVRPIL